MLAGLEHIVVTGCGHVVGRDCDATPVLKSRKMRKFMGRQDELAVIAATRAVEGAALPKALGERCGLYLSVGFIPFEGADLAMLVESSTADGRFSMQRFSTDAFRSLSPLLTFRCLPNMPAFHVSLNLDVQGPYSVGYPGIGQFYLALEEAAAALDDGTIDVALVGGVTDQDNVLVHHHFSRIDGPIDAVALASAAGFLVLERQPDADRRGAPWRARPIACEIRYCPADPFEVCGTHEEHTMIHDVLCDDIASLGPASLAVALSTASTETEHPIRGLAPNRVLMHTVRSRDRFVAFSEWEIT